MSDFNKKNIKITVEIKMQRLLLLILTIDNRARAVIIAGDSFIKLLAVGRPNWWRSSTMKLSNSHEKSVVSNVLGSILSVTYDSFVC